MWKKVDSELQDAVLNAIVKAQQWAKHRRIQELRREIEKLQSEL
jgi:TRAP-type C4-dicarboxylate transport system substrate-binding protein